MSGAPHAKCIKRYNDVPSFFKTLFRSGALLHGARRPLAAARRRHRMAPFRQQGRRSVLPSGASGQERQDIQGHQIQDDDRRLRCRRKSAARRTPADARGTFRPLDLARRAAPAAQRPQGRHVADRAAAAAGAVSAALQPRTGPAPRGPARHHGLGAMPRPQRDRVAGEVRARRLVRRSRVARHGITARKVLRRADISSATSATMEPFRGND